jgi:hypothetical protein
MSGSLPRFFYKKSSPPHFSHVDFICLVLYYMPPPPWLVSLTAHALWWSALYFYCLQSLLPNRIATLKPIPIALVIPGSPTSVVHSPASATSETDLGLQHVALQGKSASTMVRTIHRLPSRQLLLIVPSLWSPD